MCVCICVCISAAKLLKAQQLYTHTHIYIYIEREREGLPIFQRLRFLFYFGRDGKFYIHFLFLPVSTELEVKDLFLIAVIQKTRNKETKGDNLFSSLDCLTHYNEHTLIFNFKDILS